MAFPIKNKLCLVTGGSNGIGLCYVKELLKNGAEKVSIIDLEPMPKEENAFLEKNFGRQSFQLFLADVTNKSDLKGAFKNAHKIMGGIDLVINNAGVMNDEKWEEEIQLNCNAVVEGSLTALDYMSLENGGKGGCIVNIASILGLQELAGCPVYVGTKHFVVGFNRSLGMPYHFKKTGVKVLTMCPGVTDTTLISMAHARQWSKEIGIECQRELATLPSQKTDDCARGMILLIENGKSGSVWVCEGGSMIYEVKMPDRRKLEILQIKRTVVDNLRST